MDVPVARQVTVRNLGLTAYERVHALQRRLQALRAEGRAPDTLLVTEHEPVFTLGRNHPEAGFRPDAAQGGAGGIGFVQTERGGNITYHGPGQLVVYGIIGLREWDIRPLDYVHGLEEVVIGVMADLGLQGERSPLGRGVWAGSAKVASVGINVRRGVSMHGIAVNVATDLGPFDLINPCGMADVRMTSLAALVGRQVAMNRAEESFLEHFRRVLACETATGPLPAHVDRGAESAGA